MSAVITTTPFAAKQSPATGLLALAARMGRQYLAVLNNKTGAGESIVAFKLGATFNSNLDSIQTVTFTKTPTQGVYRLNFGGQQTADLAYNADTAAVTAALEALSTIGSGKVTATVAVVGLNTTITIEFISTKGNQPQTAVTVSNSTLKSDAGTTAVQTLTFSPTPQAGTFTLSFGGQTTPGISFDAVAADIQAALEGLSSIGAGNVTVSGNMPGPVTITFAGTLVKAPQALITGVSSLTNSASAVTAVQKIYATGIPDSGSWKIQHGADITAALAYNVTAAQIQTALRAFASLSNTVTVTGNFTIGFTVTFTDIVGPVSLLQILSAESLLLGGNVDGQTPPEMTGGQQILVQAVTTVAGVGTVPSALTLTNTTPGVVATPSVATVAQTQAGATNDPTEGYVLLPGQKQEFEGENTPADAVYIRAISADLTVQVLEG